jgi:hypothetical protein
MSDDDLEYAEIIPDGKHCPNCGRDIGVGAIFVAKMPNRIWCPHCRIRLTYRKIWGLLLVLLLLLFALIYACFIVVQLLGFEGMDQTPAFIILLIAAWVPIELVSILYLRATKTLEVAKKASARDPRRT